MSLNIVYEHKGKFKFSLFNREGNIFFANIKEQIGSRNDIYEFAERNDADKEFKLHTGYFLENDHLIVTPGSILISRYHFVR